MSVMDEDARIESEPVADDFIRHPSHVLPGHRDKTWSIFWVMVRHPFKRGWLGDAYNKYGVQVTAIRCRACKRLTWFTPVIEPEIRQFNEVCLADECPSYDPHRDVSFLMGGNG